MKEAMKIHFEIMEDLSAEQKAKMEELKAIMIGVANSWLEDYKKIGRAYGITEDAEEEIYTDGYKGVNDFMADIVSAGPAWEGWQALRGLSASGEGKNTSNRAKHKIDR